MNRHRIRPPDTSGTSRLQVYVPYPIDMWLGCLDDSPCGRGGHDGFDAAVRQFTIDDVARMYDLEPWQTELLRKQLEEKA